MDILSGKLYINTYHKKHESNAYHQKLIEIKKNRKAIIDDILKNLQNIKNLKEADANNIRKSKTPTTINSIEFSTDELSSLYEGHLNILIDHICELYELVKELDSGSYSGNNLFESTLTNENITEDDRRKLLKNIAIDLPIFKYIINRLGFINRKYPQLIDYHIIAIVYIVFEVFMENTISTNLEYRFFMFCNLSKIVSKILYDDIKYDIFKFIIYYDDLDFDRGAQDIFYNTSVFMQSVFTLNGEYIKSINGTNYSIDDTKTKKTDYIYEKPVNYRKTITTPKNIHSNLLNTTLNLLLHTKLLNNIYITDHVINFFKTVDYFSNRHHHYIFGLQNVIIDFDDFDYIEYDEIIKVYPQITDIIDRLIGLTQLMELLKECELSKKSKIEISSSVIVNVLDEYIGAKKLEDPNELLSYILSLMNLYPIYKFITLLETGGSKYNKLKKGLIFLLNNLIIDNYVDTDPKYSALRRVGSKAITNNNIYTLFKNNPRKTGSRIDAIRIPKIDYNDLISIRAPIGTIPDVDSDIEFKSEYAKDLDKVLKELASKAVAKEYYDFSFTNIEKGIKNHLVKNSPGEQGDFKRDAKAESFYGKNIILRFFGSQKKDTLIDFTTLDLRTYFFHIYVIDKKRYNESCSYELKGLIIKREYKDTKAIYSTYITNITNPWGSKIDLNSYIFTECGGGGDVPINKLATSNRENLVSENISTLIYERINIGLI